MAPVSLIQFSEQQIEAKSDIHMLATVNINLTKGPLRVDIRVPLVV